MGPVLVLAPVGLERRVSTIHTFQGKEAEAVIPMPGAGRDVQPGSRNWVGQHN